VLNGIDLKKRNLLIWRKYILIIVLIGLIVTASAITGTWFMMPHKNGDAEIEETTTTTMTTTTTSSSSSKPQTTTISSSNPQTTTTTFHPTTTSTEPDETTTEIISTTQSSTTTTMAPTLPPVITLESFRSRDDWSAEPPKATIELALPIYRIIIAHTAGEICNNEDDCKRVVKELQQSSTHLDDIPFNFLIGDDSRIYEGRGFKHQGQHTSNKDATEYNSIGICIAFIGDYASDELSESQVAVFNDFVQYFVENGVVSENYTIFSQDQLVRNEKSADKLFEVIQMWSRFRSRE
jgi:hypothetical protein